MKKVLLLLLFVITVNSKLYAFDWCFEIAGSKYRINPLLLRSIAIVESGLNPSAISKNKNNTEDMGIMQVNSMWLKTLRRYKLDKEVLLKNPCQNIAIGAWILSQCINRFGYSWKAVDCYNKGPTKAKKYSDYVLKVYRVMESLKKREKK